MKAALMRKFGPLPAAAWLAILAGAVYFYRRFNGAAGGSSSATTGTDTGAAAATGFGTPAVGGGGSDSGLQPDQASPLGTADPGLSGFGTPVVFDPATGQYGTLDGSGNFITSPAPEPIGNTSDAPAEILPPVAFGGAKKPALPRVHLPTASAHPASSKGTRSGTKKLRGAPAPISENSPAGHPHAQSTQVKPPAAKRTQVVHAAPAPARPRVAATAPVTRTVAPISENSPKAQPKPVAKPAAPSRGSSRAKLD